ncbi:MAG TPA: MOSC and FAD-binding oxidoreductase domain-containing protein [Pyrinomonadaceae bacterium]
MARLLSVNVGLPRDIEWKGRVVHTGIWKSPVHESVRVGRLNVEGDGQGDLGGHGGEQRAVFVYQIESYRFWEEQLKRNDFIFGQFGENFTIEGLADEVVCIGDRYQIGSAIFEVTQPRVTCYRVGIRMNEPRMPALLTSTGRPGFYFRVLQEGSVNANDEIVKVGEAKVRMTVAEINALLYSPNHPRDQLERALTIEALSLGWRSSFAAMLNSKSSGNAGLIPEAASHPTTPGFRSLRITEINKESADVLSFTLQCADGQSLQASSPGQYVVLRLKPRDNPIFFRSYSLSGPSSTERYRISVKIEPDGRGGKFLTEQVHPGDEIDVSSPRGSFILENSDHPLVMLSAGIGATPVLAMLYALVATSSERQVFWIHAARDGEHHPFAAEARQLMDQLKNARTYISYSRPGPLDQGYDSSGHLSRTIFNKIGIPQNSDVYLCGPTRFMTEMKEELVSLGLSPNQIRMEIFNGSESMTPGIAKVNTKLPHPLANDLATGPLVSFARSGISAHWDNTRTQNILELAEACDVPVRWSCRTGVCHSCESGLVSGTIQYSPEPLEAPAEGNILVCCAQPREDIVVDL